MTIGTAEGPSQPFGRTQGRPTPDLRWRAGLPALLTIVLACAIGLLVSGQSSGFEAPAIVPRSLVVVSLLAAPGLIGLLGALSRRREIVVAAGVACIAQSPISFAGVTLVFLLPGLLMLHAASGAPAAQRMRPTRTVLAVIASIPIALLVLRFTGIYGLLLLVAIAGVASGLRGRRSERARVDPRRGLVGVLIVVLLFGAWVAALGLTETVCYTARTGADGVVRVERTDESDATSVDSSEVGGGCASGMPTTGGLAATGALLAGALLLSATPLLRSGRRGSERRFDGDEERG